MRRWRLWRRVKRALGLAPPEPPAGEPPDHAAALVPSGRLAGRSAAAASHSSSPRSPRTSTPAGASRPRSLQTPRGSRRRGGDAGGPVRRARPRALLVGARAARARANEARPPAASLSGQVRAPARRGAAGALRPARRSRARPVRRLGDDAGAVARIGLRRRGCGHRRVQRAPDLRQDARARPRGARGRRPRRGRRISASRTSSRPASSASGSRRRRPPSCSTFAR